MIEQVLKAIREFFYRKNFHEVVVPILHTSLPLEPNIYAFQIGKYFLPTSPEATLKKAIAKGIGNCFAIGSTFRNLEGSGKLHKPEFLMLEWYREDADYRKIMEECRDLILFLNQLRKGGPCKANLAGEWRKLSMVDLFKKYAKLELEEIIDDKKIITIAQKKRYRVRDASWEQIFNQIFLNEIEPHLPQEPFFLIDYPAKISPLCQPQKARPFEAERFELYMDGIEIANGNTENTDAEGILRSMKKEEKYRKRMGILSPPIDMEFIEALRKMKGRSYAGIGLGVERLAMVLEGVSDIDKID